MAYLNTSQQLYYDESSYYGNYQFISLKDIIDQFMVVYVGEDKIINKARRTDVAFHAMRGMQEFSFDVFKSCKSLEIEVDPTLTEPLPHDYVNYTKISWVDSAGIKHPLYPTLSNTSNATPAPFKSEENTYSIKADGVLSTSSSYVALDKKYTNIAVGMLVVAPNIPIATYVIDVNDQNHGGSAEGVTQILLGDSRVLGITGNLVTPTYDGIETLTFTQPNGVPIPKIKDFKILHPVTFNLNENKISLSTTSVSGINVGMKVSGVAFPYDTQVVDIGQNQSGFSTITVSHNSYSASNITNDEVRFFNIVEDSTAWENYKTHTPSENTNDDYEVDDDIYDLNIGQRYGLEPSHTQVNGSFYIDCNSGKIHFSSNVAGKNVIIDYISDGLGTDEEMKVHKMAEEAMYKWITHAILASKANTPEYLVARFKKERFAETRKAKLRLSSIKLEELTQMLRAKSKWIKH